MESRDAAAPGGRETSKGNRGETAQEVGGKSGPSASPELREEQGSKWQNLSPEAGSLWTRGEGETRDLILFEGQWRPQLSTTMGSVQLQVVAGGLGTRGRKSEPNVFSQALLWTEGESRQEVLGTKGHGGR